MPNSTRARLVDTRGYRTLRAGSVVFGLLGGAPDGDGARNDEACGYTAEDVEEVAAALRANSGGARYLVAWHVPSGAPGQFAPGVDVGDPRLRALMDALHLSGGVFAWPPAQAGRSFGDPPRMESVVVPVAGLALERGDGALVAPRVTVLAL